MDDKPNSTGVIGDEKEKGDEILKSQCSQTTASEVDAEPTEETVVEHNVRCESGPATALYVCRPRSVEGHRPEPLHSLLPPFEEIQKLPDVSQSPPRSKGHHHSLKTSSAHTAAGGSDLCAEILLHCLFCRPLDCLLEIFRGGTACVRSLCGCEPVRPASKASPPGVHPNPRPVPLHRL